MSGGIKVVIQDENGKIYNLYPYHSRLQDWFVHDDFINKDPIKRKKRLKHILKEWKKDIKEMNTNPDSLDQSMLESCQYSAPEWYGICFVSFKHLIITNTQRGSSIDLVHVSPRMNSKKEIDRIKALAQVDGQDYLVKIHYHPWLVIDHLSSTSHKHIIKGIMESCGIKFTEKENELWDKYEY